MTSIEERCPYCGGDGFTGFGSCWLCEGAGTITVRLRECRCCDCNDLRTAEPTTQEGR